MITLPIIVLAALTGVSEGQTLRTEEEQERNLARSSWMKCADEKPEEGGSNICTCSTKVRYGDAATNAWSVAKTSSEASVVCAEEEFGEDPKPGVEKTCQCYVGSGCLDCGFSAQICCREPGKSERCELESKCNTQTNKQRYCNDKEQGPCKCTSTPGQPLEGFPQDDPGAYCADDELCDIAVFSLGVSRCKKIQSEVTSQKNGWGCFDCVFSLQICCQEPGKSDRCEYAEKCPSYTTTTPTPTTTMRAAREPCICVRNYQPVCLDGTTYDNECEAMCGREEMSANIQEGACLATTPTPTIKAAAVDCKSKLTEGDCKSQLCSWIEPRAWETKKKGYCEGKSVWQ